MVMTCLGFSNCIIGIRDSGAAAGALGVQQCFFIKCLRKI